MYKDTLNPKYIHFIKNNSNNTYNKQFKQYEVRIQVNIFNNYTREYEHLKETI